MREDYFYTFVFYKNNCFDLKICSKQFFYFPEDSMKDIEYMKKAIELAYQGEGNVNPNPMVGAVIVKNDKIIGEGFHEYFGKEHAEINAFNKLTESCENATMYVTLEPCCHFGKTPPCVDEIINKKIKRVVIGTLDPNPLMSGKSVDILKNNNIEVVVGVLEQECKNLIKEFSHFIKNKKPFITLKYAMTIDGKVATRTNKSKWISNEKALFSNRVDRYKNTAIMVGINTVLIDDPLLTTRIKNKRNPIRIICDTNLRIPLTSNIVKTANEVKTIVATCCEDVEKAEKLLEKNIAILNIKMKNNHLDLNDLVEKLGAIGIDSIILEGARTLASNFIEEKLINYLKIYVCPKIFGGKDAVSPIGGIGVDEPSDAIKIINQKVSSIDDDVVIEGEVVY
ncbi:riboflavin biosynthesis protein RibD [Malacoplasma iowae 695]|nr:riboflavin biosynthesis protein RibD [Malacoplasma iowae 695]